MSQNSTQWDLLRFIKTLSYFGVVPLLSNVDWFQQWFGSRPNPKVDSHPIGKAQPNLAIMQPEILVIGANSSFGQQAVRQLTQQGNAVKLVVTQEADFGELPVLKLEQTDHLLPAELLEQVEQARAVVCCADAPNLTESTIAQVIAQLSTQTRLVRHSIFDFAHPDGDLTEVWGALDDVVMGGVSQSTIRLADGVAYFSGMVSTANSGGFASIRTRNLQPPLDLSCYEGVELRVKGDGKRYKFMLRSETRWDGVAHCFSFDTAADQWVTVHIPFADLIPVFRARTVTGSPIDPSHICAWQLMLSKFEYDEALNPHFEPGSFQLQIASIQVYRHEPLKLIVLRSAADLADLTALAALTTLS